MHISVVCPRCEGQYQLEESMLGQTIRCPNKQCRETFKVTRPGESTSSSAAPTALSDPPKQSGSIADMVPLVSSEAVQTSPSPKPTPPEKEPPGLAGVPFVQSEAAVPEPPSSRQASWEDAPPVRNGNEESPPVDPPAAEAPKSPSPPSAEEPSSGPKVLNWGDAAKEAPETKKETEGPTEHAPGHWEPPPVRTGTAAEEGEVTEGATRRRKRAKLWMILIVLGVIGTLTGAGYYLWTILQETEEKLVARAAEAYKIGRYDIAAERYKRVIAKFEDSENLDKYRFLVDLCLFRHKAKSPRIPLEEVFKEADGFSEKHEKSPYLEERSKELVASVVERMQKFVEQSGRVDPAIEPMVNRTEAMLQSLDQRFAEAISQADKDKLAEGFARLREAIALERRRQAVLAELAALKDTMKKKPSAQIIRQAKVMIRERSREVPGLADDPDATGIVEELYESHLKSVTFTPRGPDQKPRKRIPEELEPSILATPLVKGPTRFALGNKVVLGLARGVLYAMDSGTGTVKWARRVGIDTTTLPLRLPASPTNPTELILVLSTDTRSLTALDLEGRALWNYRFDSPALGRPLLVGHRAFIPTYDGEVHEIEVVNGALIGRYSLHQRLSVGGAHRYLNGHDLLYFPAEDSCVFILDATERKCKTILYTWHPGGSLRSEPLLVGGAGLEEGGDDPLIPSYLILNQTKGLDQTQLRVFSLPIESRDENALRMRPEPELQGWTWFPPYHDGEKVVVLSDAGRLGLFGIRQQRNRDNPLFPLIPPGANGQETQGIDVTRFLALPPVTQQEKVMFGQRRRGRAQVAHVLSNEFWVLAMGQMQRLEIRWDKQTGPQPVQLWKSPLTLGSPLHSSQVIEDFDQTTLFAVTQKLGGTTCYATAIAPETIFDDTVIADKRILWQRQLGVVCPYEPFPMAGGLMAIDESGALFRFNPKKFPQEDNTWHAISGSPISVGMQRSSGQRYQLTLEGRSLYQLTPGDNGTELVLRKYTSGIQVDPDDDPKGTVTESRVKITSPLAGSVAILGDYIIAPLRDGKFYRFTLPLKARGTGGYSWRSRQVGPEAVGHIVPVGEDEFLTTDGRNGIKRWEWKGRFCRSLPTGGDNDLRKLEARIIGKPIVLKGKAGDPLRVCLADSRGKLILLEGPRLQLKREWDLNGSLTRGPFLRGSEIGCIVDQNKLVWIDPSKDGALWTYGNGDEAIVGEPQVVEDLVLVADQSGHYRGIDPTSGQLLGKGYQVKATVAPSCSPVAFGKGRAFAPLTDGTILLLSLDLLKASFWQRWFE